MTATCVRCNNSTTNEARNNERNNLKADTLNDSTNNDDNTAEDKKFNEIILLQDSVIDNNLKSNLAEFEASIYKGNLDKAYSYFFPGAVKSLQNKFPDYGIDDKYIKENILKLGHEAIKKLDIKYHAKPKFVLGEIIHREKCNGLLVYVIKNSAEITLKGKRMKIPSKTICFSSEKGKNWTFMELDAEASPNVLVENFNQALAHRIVMLLNK